MRIMTSTFALLAALSCAISARADVYCEDTLAFVDTDGVWQPAPFQEDECTSEASIIIATSTEDCVCYGACSPFCLAFEPIEGDVACHLSDPYFAVIGGDVAACELCMSVRCSAQIAACMADGPFAGS